MNNYNFPVELQPIYYGEEGLVMPKRKAVVRPDTNEALGVVSDDYTIIKHATVIDAFREANKKINPKERIVLTNNGARLFYQMTFPKTKMTVKKGDVVQMTLTVKNSYNGGNSLSIILGALRLVCLNGMVVGTEFLQFRFKHVGNIDQIIEGEIIEQYATMYKHYTSLFEGRMSLISEMTKTQLDLPKLNETLFDKEKVLLPQYLLQEARDSFVHKGDTSVWGYYNALTYAISHRMKKESPDRALWFGIEAWKSAEKTLEGIISK